MLGTDVQLGGITYDNAFQSSMVTHVKVYRFICLQMPMDEYILCFQYLWYLYVFLFLFCFKIKTLIVDNHY